MKITVKRFVNHPQRRELTTVVNDEQYTYWYDIEDGREDAAYYDGVKMLSEFIDKEVGPA